jgi:O-antigen/teichoic acid export membrane protein
MGFVFGAINTYLFAKNNIFTTDQFGLTRVIIITGNLFNSFACVAIPSVIYKFSPYYKGNLKDKDNDLLSAALLLAFIGFVMTTMVGLVFEPLVVKKFSDKSALFVQYYFLVFPYLFFYLFFNILEAYAWSVKETVASNFLREAGNRISVTILIVLFIIGGFSFDLFIKIFSCLWGVSFLGLLFYLMKVGKLNFTFKISKVTRRYWKKMATLMGFVYAGLVITTLSASMDTFTIASYIGIGSVAIYDVSNYISNIISVPQKSVVAISIPYLAEAWRKKDLATIQRIYSRSSINLLLISIFLFTLIWLNYDTAMSILPINQAFREGKLVVLLLGLKFIVDMGTGVNGQIIVTSTYWRFEFTCGVILLSLIAPLNILLVKHLGIVGAGYSNLIAYTIYNAIRIVFLWKKFNLQPFTIKTVYALVISLVCYFICYFLFHNMHSWLSLFLTSGVYAALFGTATVYFNLSPDILPVWQTVKKRLRLN